MTNPKQRIRKIVLIDLIMCLMVICAAGCYAGLTGIKAAGLAGMTYVLPNAIRTYCTFRYQGAHAARQILKGFYQGAMLKFGVSLGLFAVVFAGCSVNPMIFFGAYIGMQMLAWLMPVFNKI